MEKEKDKITISLTLELSASPDIVELLKAVTMLINEFIASKQLETEIQRNLELHK